MSLATRNTVLFDLDGTLLPLYQEEFIKNYFGRLVRKLVPLGYDKDQLVAGIWEGTERMVRNDGAALNCDRFWDFFVPHMGRSREEMEPLFYDYYGKDFAETKEVLRDSLDRASLVRALRQRGLGVVLATNPLFPPVAVETRLNWIGLTTEDFDAVTTYENSGYCKPAPGYYRELLVRLGKTGEECVMVGNNAREDMVAGTLGLETFLVTDYLENPENTDISVFRHGSFAELEAWLLA